MVFNCLSGTIPTEILSLSDLKVLGLQRNQLSHTIPLNIGDLSSLADLFLSYNDLSGAIPTSIGQLTDLAGLSFGFNCITGSVPISITNMTSMFRFHVDHNSLSGTVPTFLGTMTGLKGIVMGANNFRGTIPTELGDITGLLFLKLENNYLTGVIPSSLLGITELKELLLGGNSMEGTIPSDISSIRRLETLDLNSNFFTGVLPSSLYDLKDLRILMLSDNHFNGTLHEKVGNMRRLNYLYMSSNSMTGIIPDSFCRMKDLKQLRLEGNAFSCYHSCLANQTVFTTDFRQHLSSCDKPGSSEPPEPPEGPPPLGSLHSHLELSRGISDTQHTIVVDSVSNDFETESDSDSINSALCELMEATGGALSSFGWRCRSGYPTSRLCRSSWEGVTCDSSGEYVLTIELASYQLSGTIPTSLGLMTTLTVLDLSKNSFTGFVPSSLEYLTDVTSLDLSYNFFSGTIPSAIGSMTSLIKLYISNNQFTDVIPSFLNNLEKLTYLRTTDNKLACYEYGLVMDDINNDITSTTSICSTLVDDVSLHDSIYTDYSTCTMTQNPTSSEWVARDFCAYYNQYQCSFEVIANYTGSGDVSGTTCPPSCLTNSPSTYCSTFALFSMGCGADEGYTYTDVNTLISSCIESYTASVATSTLISFAMEFNITNIDVTALEAALADESEAADTISLILTALSASSGIDVSALSITDIITVTTSDIDTEVHRIHTNARIDSSSVGVATIQIQASTLAEVRGEDSNAALVAAHTTKKKIKSALFDSVDSDETAFITELKELSTQEINGNFVLKRSKERTLIFLSSSSFVTTNTLSTDPGKLVGSVQYLKTAAPTPSREPTAEPSISPSSPSSAPSYEPSAPSVSPSLEPTQEPTVEVTSEDTELNTSSTPTRATSYPTLKPTSRPTRLTPRPSPRESFQPQSLPSRVPFLTSIPTPSINQPCLINGVPSSVPSPHPISAPEKMPIRSTSKPKTRRPHYVHRISRSPSFGPHRRTKRPPKPIGANSEVF